MNQNYVIQYCTPADCQAIADIYNHYIPQNGHTMDTNLQTKEDIQSWLDHFNGREELHVLKVEGVVIGWGIIKRYTNRGGYQVACEISLYIHPDYLREGYGIHLKKYLFKRCKALGYAHVVGKIWASNTASLNYVKKLGYEVVGTQKRVGFKNGKWIDVVIVQYLL